MNVRPSVRAKLCWALKNIPYICPTPFFLPRLTSILRITLRVFAIHFLFFHGLGHVSSHPGGISGLFPALLSPKDSAETIDKTILFCLPPRFVVKIKQRHVCEST